MITMKDCIDMCGLTEKEVMAIAEHEHVPEMAAAAMARYLLKKPDGAEQIRDMIHATTFTPRSAAAIRTTQANF